MRKLTFTTILTVVSIIVIVPSLPIVTRGANLGRRAGTGKGLMLCQCCFDRTGGRGWTAPSEGSPGFRAALSNPGHPSIHE